MQKKWKELARISKYVLSKENYLRLKTIKDEDERASAAQVALISKLEKSHHLLDHEIKKIGSKNPEVFFARNKCDMLGPRIKRLKHDFTSHDLIKTLILRNEIYKELAYGVV